MVVLRSSSVLDPSACGVTQVARVVENYLVSFGVDDPYHLSISMVNEGRAIR